MATDPVVSNVSLPPEFCESYPTPLTTCTSPTLPTYHLNFDGVNDKIAIPHAASINNLPTANFTIDWVGSIPTDPGSFLSKIVDGYLGSGIDFYTYGDGFLYLEMYSGSGGTEYFSAAFSIPDENVHHYEIVWTKNTLTFKFFVDGVEVAADYTTPNDWNPNNYNDSTHNLSLGYYDFNYDNDYYMEETMNWLRISNTARHTSNFAPPSLTACPAVDANTVLRLALDEGAGSIAHDTSGNGNNGTISGATWEAD